MIRRLKLLIHHERARTHTDSGKKKIIRRHTSRQAYIWVIFAWLLSANMQWHFFGHPMTSFLLRQALYKYIAYRSRAVRFTECIEEFQLYCMWWHCHLCPQISNLINFFFVSICLIWIKSKPFLILKKEEILQQYLWIKVHMQWKFAFVW